MSQSRTTISLFKKLPKSAAVLPVRGAVRQVPIRYVSIEAVLELVARLKTEAGVE